MSVARYRERHVTSGSKSDPGDAKVLADLVCTDRHNHREAAGDSVGAEAIKVLATAHQSAIWSRQREANALRSAPRDFYPGVLDAFGTDLDDSDALAILEIAPTPALGRGISRSKIASALRKAGRVRNLKKRAAEIQSALGAEQLSQAPQLEAAYGCAVSALVAMIRAYVAQIASLEAALIEDFRRTQTPRSSSPCQAWGWYWAPGCWASSGTTRTATPISSLAEITPVHRRLREPLARATSCWLALRATRAWPMPLTSGLSVP